MRPVRTSTGGARLGVPAVVPSPSSTLGVRDIQPGQCEGARAFESGVEPIYNYHRPHGAFRGKTPYEALRERLQ